MSLVRVETLPQSPSRPVDGHKGTFGRVLLIAGCRGMSGAAILSGLGALRGGAGLVYVAAPESIVPIIAAAEPSYLTIPLEDDTHGMIALAALHDLRSQLSAMSVIGLGPGLGRSPGLRQLVTTLYREVALPMVCDADALNLLSEQDGFGEAPGGPRIVTPHPGEFARMLGTAVAPAGRESLAAEFARKSGTVLVLKGAGTIVTDGQRLSVNTTGNSGLATGGTGDVLTGLICALIAQGMEAFDAAQLGVWMHGRAGDFAAAELSQPGLIAGDLPKYLCKVWRELASSPPGAGRGP
jgi:ADP-dependent NAD(P)H-hydrate dehydratase